MNSIDIDYKTEAIKLVKKIMAVKSPQSRNNVNIAIGRGLAREVAKLFCDERMAENPDYWGKVKEYLSLKQWS